MSTSLYTSLGVRDREALLENTSTLPVCLGLSALIASRIRFHVIESFDPLSYSLKPLLLLAAALLASLLPALRAARTDPLKALREE